MDGWDLAGVRSAALYASLPFVMSGEVLPKERAAGESTERGFTFGKFCVLQMIPKNEKN